LGIKKPVVKAHGSSDVVAFRNAVKQAMDAAESDFCAEIEDGLKALSAMKEQAND
jgi:glycerol-3-phosphate acyltransferase PlsX